MTDDVDEGSAAMRGSVANHSETPKSCTLTKAEREAIDWASLVLRNMAEERDQVGDYCRRLNEAAALMLNLLQRLK